MSKSDNQPRAVIHTQILDVAEENPEASIESVAKRVPGATTPLVSRVLEDYGDPAVDDSVEQTDAPTTVEAGETTQVELGEDANSEEETDDSENGVTPESGTSITLDEISDAQRETLRAITDRPEASQRDIASVLDLSPSTVNNRLNSIPGFEWDRRADFARHLLKTDGGTATQPDLTPRERVDDEVLQRLAAIEDRLDRRDASTGPEFDDPDLVRAVMHACFESDAVSDDQERELVAKLLGTDRPSE
jgi:hypothetical protein